MPVVDDRQVGRSVGPERLGVREIDAALRRQPCVAKPVCATPPRDAELQLQIAGRAHLLDDLQALADAHHLHVGSDRLDGDRQFPRLGLGHDEPQQRTLQRRGLDAGEAYHFAPLHVQVAPLAELDPNHQAGSGRSPQRHSGRVGTPAGERLQHPEQGRAD